MLSLESYAQLSPADKVLRLAAQRQCYAQLTEATKVWLPKHQAIRERYDYQNAILAELNSDRQQDMAARDRSELAMRRAFRDGIRTRRGIADRPRPKSTPSPRYTKPERRWITASLDRSPFDAEIASIVDRDAHVASILDGLAVERVRVAAKRGPQTGKIIPAITVSRELTMVKALRRSKNGRRLLELWRERSEWRDENLDVRDELDGFAPVPDELRELECRMRMEDEAFRYSVNRDPASEEDFEAWERQEDWRRMLTEQARVALWYGELLPRGVTRAQHRAVKLWIGKLTVKHHGNMLRVYRAAIGTLRRGYYTGFGYDGFDSASFDAWREKQAA